MMMTIANFKKHNADLKDVLYEIEMDYLEIDRLQQRLTVIDKEVNEIA